MDKNKKLLNDTTLYTFAHFSSQAVVFFMLPIYTNYFSPTAFGTWDIILTSTTLIVPFITFELTSATYRWLIDPHTRYSPVEIISTGFFQLVKNTTIFNFIAIITLPFLTIPLKWETLLFINVMIFTNFLNQTARGLGRNKLFAAQGLIHALLIAGLNIYFIIFLGMGIKSFLHSHIIAGIIIATIVFLRLDVRKHLSKSSNNKQLHSSYLHYAIPIIPATASWWIMTLADRWMIGGFLGLEQNGIYAIAVKIPAVLLMVNAVFSLAWKDSAITHYHQSDKNNYYTAILKHYFRLLASTVICLILLAKPIILIFIDPAYAAAWKYSGMLLIAALFHALALFWSAGFHGAKSTHRLLTTTLIGASINIILNFILIPIAGLYAIPIATTCAFFITWLARIFMSKRFFTIRLPISDILLLGSLILLILPLPFILGETALLSAIAISFILFIIINYPLGIKVIQQFRNREH